MKIIIYTLVGIGMIVWAIYCSVFARYEWNNKYLSNWELADRASTISQKSEYVDKFVVSLQNSGLQGVNNSLFFPTPQRSFDANLDAMISLQQRLHAIKDMDESSFEYQTAIQQITQQEQGEAHATIETLQECWYKVHHYWLWNGWLNLLYALVVIGFLFMAFYHFVIWSEMDL